MAKLSGRPLAELLRASGLTRERAALELGVSTPTINNWCARRAKMSTHRLGQVAQLLTAHGAAPSAVGAYVRDELRAQGLDWEGLAGTTLPDLDAGHANRGLVSIIVWRINPLGINTRIAQAARRTLELLGHECVVLDCGGDHRAKRRYIGTAASLHAAGALLIAPGEPPYPEDDLAACGRSAYKAGMRLAIVRYWRAPSALPEHVSAIGWDPRKDAARAIDVLMEAGHSEIGALIFGGADYAPARAFIDVCREKGMDVGADQIIWHQGQIGTLDDIRYATRASTALYVDSPIGLTLAAHGLAEMGLRWPQDISLIGLGTAAHTPRLGVRPFTIIDVPAEQVGADAAHLLHDMVGRGMDQPGRFISYDPDHMAIVHADDGSVGRPRREVAAAL